VLVLLHRLRRLAISRCRGSGYCFRSRGPARPDDPGCGGEPRSPALHRPEHRVYAITVALSSPALAVSSASLYGKALRANPVIASGARLVGVRTTLSGQIAFLLASVIGALSGILIVPITQLYYDTGFRSA